MTIPTGPNDAGTTEHYINMLRAQVEAAEADAARLQLFAEDLRVFCRDRPWVLMSEHTGALLDLLLDSVPSAATARAATARGRLRTTLASCLDRRPAGDDSEVA